MRRAISLAFRRLAFPPLAFPPLAFPPLAFRPLAFPPLAACLVAACGGPGAGPVSAGICGPVENRFVPVKVEAPEGRPPVALVVRDGDPRAAVALVVATPAGSASAVGLSALFEQRLRGEGWSEVQTMVDGQGFRAAFATDDSDRIAAFVKASRSALGTPVGERPPDIRKIMQRLEQLAAHPWGSDSLAAVAACTGELGLRVAASGTESTEARVAADLERWRQDSYALGRIAYGAAGPEAVARVLTAYVDEQAWPSRTSASIPWPSEDTSGAYVVSPDSPARLRVDLALWVSDADAAAGAAQHIGQTPVALADRLAALPVPFRVLEVAGVARLRGACLSARIESVRPLASDVEVAAARAAAVLRQELEQEQSRYGRKDRGAGARSQLAGQAAAAARVTADPREAAARAAWWSLAERSNSEQPTRLAVALGVAAPNLDHRNAETALEPELEAVGRRFGAALSAAERSMHAPVIQHRERLEQGQGEVWVLVATPCGTASESSADAGETALAILSRAIQRGPDSPNVVLEPWITPDAVGLVAHAPRLRDEGSEAHAVRVAEAAARAFFPAGIRADAVAQGRARLLDAIGAGVSEEGTVFAAAASALTPTHPSWLAPLGTLEGVFHASGEALSLRWQALVEGPLRVAVLANESAAQADAAVQAVDRWLVHGGGPNRMCPAAGQALAPRAGVVKTEILRTGSSAAQAMIAAPVPAPDKRERYWFELTAAALNGSAGLLSQALTSTSASASVRLVGGQRAAALVIDIRAPEGALDGCVAQVVALLRRMRQGGLTAADLDRAAAALEAQRLETKFDPRRRLADLWADRRSEAAEDPRPSLESWRGWLASGLAEDRLVVVQGAPKR